jgi:hypothetical protein
MYLTDKTGKRFWNTACGASPYSYAGEKNNLLRTLAGIQAGQPQYAKCNIDRESVRFVFEGAAEEIDFSPEAMLAWATEAR